MPQSLFTPESFDTSTPIQRGLLALLSEVERAYVDALSLREVSISPRFETLAGGIGERRLLLETKVFTGGALERLTIAVMYTPSPAGAPPALVSCTVSALPAFGVALPILGLDYVALGSKLSLVAFDLSPTDIETWSDARNNLIDLSRRADARLTARPRPQFVDQTFSPLAVFARADREFAELACGLGVTLLERHAGLCAAARPLPFARANAADTMVECWCGAMRRNKKESRALQRIFGPVAVDYLEDFLFTRDHRDPCHVTTASDSPARRVPAFA